MPIQFDANCSSEQRQHYLVMSGQREAAPIGAGRSLYHIQARAVVANKVHIGGAEATYLAPEITRQVERLEEDFRHHDRRAQIHHHSTGKSSDN